MDSNIFLKGLQFFGRGSALIIEFRVVDIHHRFPLVTSKISTSYEVFPLARGHQLLGEIQSTFVRAVVVTYSDRHGDHQFVSET